MSRIFTLNGTTSTDPKVEEWLWSNPPELFALARFWFSRFRDCGQDITEVLHDGCPVACIGDAALGYVNVFSQHVNVGFYQGAELPDPQHLLQGKGRFMRHVKLVPGKPLNAEALDQLIVAAADHLRARLKEARCR